MNISGVHALVFPFPTQGHVTPLADLATRLAEAGVFVTLVHTPDNFRVLRHAVKSSNAANSNGFAITNLQVLPLPLAPEIDRLLPASAPMPTIFQTVDTLLAEPLEALIHQINRCSDGRLPAVSCIISDSFMPWTLELANRLGIPRVEMWTASATSYYVGRQFPEFIIRGLFPLKSGNEHDEKVVDFVPEIVAADGRKPTVGEVLAMDLLDRDVDHPELQFIIRAFQSGKKSFRVLVNSAEEVEPAVLGDAGEGLVPIGPMLESDKGPVYSSLGTGLLKEEGAEEWLDAQDEDSVVYVAFGSAARLNEAELRELAEALESVGRPYLWAIRDHSVKTLGRVMSSGRGKLVEWAAQRRVLAHKAVGAFVSHCGWNSVVESMYAGVPIIGCPRLGEQNLNLWLVSQIWRAGIRGCPPSGDICREYLESVITRVFSGEEGVNLKDNATSVSRRIRGALCPDTGSSCKSFHTLVRDLVRASRSSRLCPPKRNFYVNNNKIST